MYVCSKQTVLIFLHLKMSCFSFLKECFFLKRRISNRNSFIHSFSLSLFFFCQHLKNIVLLPSVHGLCEKSAVIGLFFTTTRVVSLAAIKIFFLSLVFRSLIMICLRMNFFGFVLFGDLAKFGNFPAIIYLSFFILNFIFN